MIETIDTVSRRNDILLLNSEGWNEVAGNPFHFNGLATELEPDFQESFPSNFLLFITIPAYIQLDLQLLELSNCY